MQCSEYGPDVVCEFDDYGIVGTHRPAGAGGPFFCMTCGRTDHLTLAEDRARQEAAMLAPAPVEG